MAGSKWGDPRSNQIEASYEDQKFEEVPGKPQKKGKYLGVHTFSISKGDKVYDDIEALRWFKHRCGLVMAINVLAGSSSMLTLYLGGFQNVKIDIRQTEFKFDPKLKEGPVADVVFRGYCTRYGEMKNGHTTESVTLVFKDQAQMKEYLVATTSEPDPETVKAYRHRDGGSSQTRNSLWPLVLGVAAVSCIGSK